MAFLGQDDKEQQGSQNQGAQAAGSGAPLTNTGGGDVGSGAPVSTAGVGAGGSGGWTNIQAYLNANQGNTNSADALNKEVSGTFDQEKQNLGQQSSQVQTQAKSQVDQNHMGQDQASSLIQQAGQNAQGSDPYNQAVNGVKSHLNQQYTDPGQFSYGQSAKTQEYGSDLNPANQGGFQSLMGSLYNKSAGGHMGDGQLALQTQLDSNNGALDTTRQNLMGQYQGLNSLIQGTTDQTNQALAGYKNQFGQDQQDLKNYLGSQATDTRNTIDQNIAKANNTQDDFLKYYLNTEKQAYPWQQFDVASKPTFNESNLSGEDYRRGAFNGIQDMLGTGAGIAAAPVANPWDVSIHHAGQMPGGEAVDATSPIGKDDYQNLFRSWLGSGQASGQPTFDQVGAVGRTRQPTLG